MENEDNFYNSLILSSTHFPSYTSLVLNVNWPSP